MFRNLPKDTTPDFLINQSSLIQNRGIHFLNALNTAEKETDFSYGYDFSFTNLLDGKHNTELLSILAADRYEVAIELLQKFILESDIPSFLRGEEFFAEEAQDEEDEDDDDSREIIDINFLNSEKTVIGIFDSLRSYIEKNYQDVENPIITLITIQSSYLEIERLLELSFNVFPSLEKQLHSPDSKPPQFKH